MNNVGRLFAIALAVTSAGGVAAAQPPTAPATEKATAGAIDLTAPLHTETGAPMTECVKAAADGKGCDKSQVVTVGEAISHALFSTLPSDIGPRGESLVSGEVKWERGVLAEKVKGAKHITFSLAEATMIKKCVGELYSPLLVAQLFPLIDPHGP